ncbi:MAG: CsbD family protein [Candidatus Nanopelagicales bacterium]|jgi:uncharacterized protein YjbJ (UPF0337 family)|nr:CsbD family protein [Candidatus Nanopelagicales bacterium]MDP4906961.1 CsbD family protein [Candidatus Nanopelagicales bacterium]MDP4974317.1 CsbD family protein [Candidatus Nanopelagicales bacterium]MDP5095744.1 CsbD family protein [Candidatus Nanopelagicales bacterium]
MDINADQAKGKIKEAVGDLTDDDKLKSEGQADQLVGDAKETVKNVADKVDDVLDNIEQVLHKD